MEILNKQNKANKIGEIGIYIYALSVFISKLGVNTGIFLMGFSFFVLLFMEKQKFYLEKEEKFFLLVLLLLIISNLFSPGSFYSFERVITKTHRYLGILFIPIFLKNQKILKNTFYFLILSLIINFIKGTYQYFKLSWDLSHRYISFASNTLDDAHMMAMFSVFLLAIFIYTIKYELLKYKIFLGTLFSISFTILILSQGRGAWISFIGGGFLSLFILLKNKWTFLLKVLTSFILGYFMIINIPQINNNQYFKRFESILETKSSPSNGIRLLMWEASLDTFKNNFLFGVGRNKFSNYALNYFEKNKTYEKINYGNALKKIASSGNQHSMYFKSLSEDGLFFFPFIGMFIYFFYRQFNFFKKLKKNILEKYVVLGSIGVLIAFCIGGLTEISWNEIWFSNFFCFIIGSYLGIKKYLKIGVFFNENNL